MLVLSLLLAGAMVLQEDTKYSIPDEECVFTLEASYPPKEIEVQHQIMKEDKRSRDFYYLFENGNYLSIQYVACIHHTMSALYLLPNYVLGGEFGIIEMNEEQIKEQIFIFSDMVLKNHQKEIFFKEVEKADFSKPVVEISFYSEIYGLYEFILRNHDYSLLIDFSLMQN